MMSCFSYERLLNRQMERDMKADEVSDANQIKVLFLGTGESGKSTILKQLAFLYGKKFTDIEFRQFKTTLYMTVVSDAKRLIESVRIPLVRQVIQAKGFDPDNLPAPIKDAMQQILQMKQQSTFSSLRPQKANLIAQVWAHPMFRYAASVSGIFPSEFGYFLDKIKEIAKPGWQPTDEDIVRARVRTTGIMDQTIVMKRGDVEDVIRLIDVGGQRSDRRKWMSSFQTMTAVVFVAAISEYDELCWEDNKTRRIDEALSVFDEVCKSELLADASIILFLNKTDLFRAKLLEVPFGRFFPDYVGAGEFESASAYLEARFRQVAKAAFAKWDRAAAASGALSRTLSVHFTTAVNKNNVNLVFNHVKQIILQKAVEKLMSFP